MDVDVDLAALTTLVFNKEFVPPLDVTDKIPFGASPELNSDICVAAKPKGKRAAEYALRERSKLCEYESELNMRQCHWLELLSDYDCDIRYHPGKANVVANALSLKERIEPLRVRALVMKIGLDLPKRILEAQIETQKPENLVNEDVGGVGYLAMEI
ncbi:hypothetical protein Tco_1229937 [Tanacetum coccineum]